MKHGTQVAGQKKQSKEPTAAHPMIFIFFGLGFVKVLPYTSSYPIMTSPCFGSWSGSTSMTPGIGSSNKSIIFNIMDILNIFNIEKMKLPIY
jgi:hypothetical protein